ncbi:MAG: amidohydrolase [Sphaerochaetaceae bacterium]|nr:amidohydrolase [Sphaerochaetaceae bacterium]
MVTTHHEELIRLRREFHRYPELGFAEFRTQSIVMEYLGELGLDPKPIGGTGVVATLSGCEGGRTVMLRADMDGLPVTERTGLPYASCNEGLMHACGHDGHMAMLLIAAKILVSRKEQFSGNMKFVFQPNEENAGASILIEQGVMADPHVDGVFGLHLWSALPSGTIDIIDGPQMAGAYDFSLEIIGAGGHAGFAHKAIDPIVAASAVIQAVQSIQTRELNAQDPAVIMFTQVVAGSSQNIIPESATLRGTIRFLYEGGEHILEAFRRTAEHVCAAYRTECKLSIILGNSLLSNDPRMASMMRDEAAIVLGREGTVSRHIRTMAGEDFSEYLRFAPGAFAFLGVNNPDAGSVYPHHHPKFTIDEKMLPVGTELLVRSALRFLAPGA